MIAKSYRAFEEFFIRMRSCSIGIVKTDVLFLRQHVKTVLKLFRMRVRAKLLDGILIVYTEGCIRKEYAYVKIMSTKNK